MKHKQLHSDCLRAIDAIAADNAAGAADIVRRAAAIFSLIDASQCADLGQANTLIAGVCDGLVAAQPDMAPVLNLANAVRGAAASGGGPAEALRLAVKAAGDFSRLAAAAYVETAKQAAKLIRPGCKLLTHSRSSTVLEALSTAARKGVAFGVIATESRPVLEGRTLATELANAGIVVTLIADAAAATVLSEIDLVLVGADRVTPEAVVNKIGTLMIALAARERAIPIHAVCDTTKFTASAHSSAAKRRQRDPAELWTDPPSNVRVRNEYFEETPLKYFAAVVTEHGFLNPTEAARRAASLPL
jgi:translation initiation factor eIF-2B subunit delta